MTRAYNTATTQQNSGGAVNPFVAGKNAIINGAFDFWQRGTSFSSTGYTADRWNVNFSGATGTVSQQTFTPGTAPVAGYEGQFFLRLATTVADDNSRIEQKIENVRTFAGQTVTVSLWAKADSARTITLNPYQSFGSGGSADVSITGQTISVTTAWTRFTKTFDVPSVSGKTIGTGSFLSLELLHAPNATFTLDLWGVQVEAGSVATPFTTATGTIQGELAACQRYYVKIGGSAAYETIGLGSGWSSTRTGIQIKLPTTMRIAPSSVDYALPLELSDSVTGYAVTTASMTNAGKDVAVFRADVASGLTQFRPYSLTTNNSTSAYVAFSAEL